VFFVDGFFRLFHFNPHFSNPFAHAIPLNIELQLTSQSLALPPKKLCKHADSKDERGDWEDILDVAVVVTPFLIA
jgi:hypothetical protein